MSHLKMKVCQKSDQISEKNESVQTHACRSRYHSRHFLLSDQTVSRLIKNITKGIF
jgi:hypothetical protein